MSPENDTPPKTSGRSSRERFRRFRQELREPSGKTESSGKCARDQEASAHRRENFRLYLKTIWIFRWKIVVVLLLAVVVTVLEAIQPRFIGEAIDKVLSNPALNLALKQQQLLSYTLLLLGLVVIARAVDTWRDYRTHALNTHVLSRLRRMLYAQLIRFPIARLYEIKTGGIVSRLTGDLEQLSGLVQMAFISPTVALLRVGFTFVIVCMWNLKLAVVLLLLLAPMAFGSFLWLGPIRKIWNYYWKQKGEVDARISETFSGIRVVRAFQREEAEEIRNAVAQHSLARFNLFAVRYTTSVHILWSVLIPLANVAVLYVGGRLMFDGTASIGQITGLMAYTAMLMGPVYQIVQTFGDLQKSLAAIDRVFDHLREPDELDDPPDAVEAPARVERIEFQNLGFAYAKEKSVIQDFSLSVPRGACVALVGASVLVK